MRVSAILVTFIFWCGQASAAVWQIPSSPPKPATAAAEVSPCPHAQIVVDGLLAAAMTRLETARQLNSASALRAAVDDLQTTLRDVRAQLAPCALPQVAPDPHAGHTSAPAPKPANRTAPSRPAPSGQKPPTTDPHAAHSPEASNEASAPAGTNTTQVVDPVCGLKVDPASAPSARHQDQTYHFCSEQHRQLFQKNPAKYLPRGR